MTGSAVARLRVADEGFLVSSLIERCPRTMMLRELLRNALEAAETAAAGERRVRIGAFAVDGTPKLAIRNTGRGMDAAELFRMGDIAASIRKEHGLDRNFGMGAKVAALPSNRLGLRYRSCHAGRVHEVLLGCRDGVYGRVLRPDGAGGMADVLPCGTDPGADWTEVVLLGNHAGQDTVRDPHDGAPGVAADWLDDTLAHRFFRIGGGVEVRLDTEDRVFRPLSERIDGRCRQREAVTLPDGTTLHFVHDAPGAGSCAIVHRDEIYDLHRGEAWQHVAPLFGIAFGASEVSLLVEVPDRGAMVPDAYRQFLRHRDGGQDRVEVRHFQVAAHRARPDWLVALVARHAPSLRVSGAVYDQLDGLLRRLGVRLRPRALAATRSGKPASGPAAAMPGDAAAGDAPAQPPAQPPVEFEPAPEILLLRDGAEIAARGVVERAGRYYPETHQLFLNAAYPAVLDMRAELERRLAASGGGETMRMRAQELAEQSLALRVGRFLVFGLARQEQWPPHAVASAGSVEALSIAADDYAGCLPDAERQLRAEFGSGG